MDGYATIALILMSTTLSPDRTEALKHNQKLIMLGIIMLILHREDATRDFI